jgi:hypothetical protein
MREAELRSMWNDKAHRTGADLSEITGLGLAVVHALGSSGHRTGLTLISPARTAPFSVAALTGRPSAVSSRAIAVNIACTSPTDSAASGTPPRYGTR